MVLRRLAVSYYAVHLARTAITIAAIALSISLITAVTSGYASIEGAASGALNRYLGAADAFINPSNDYQGLVPEDLVGQLNADPDVRHAIGRLETDRQMQRAGTVVAATSPQEQMRVAAGYTAPSQIDVHLVGIRRPEDTQTDALQVTQGKWFDGDTGNDAVIDEMAQEVLGIKLGDTVEIPGLQPLRLKVVATVHKPSFFSDRVATVYVPLRTLQEFVKHVDPPMVSIITIELRNAADSQAFKDRWTAILAKRDGNLALHMRRENNGELENHLRGIRIMSGLGAAMALLTGAFITFSALSMGVTERQRMLAMLRAIGATSGQVFRLVVMEGIFLWVVGAIIGIPLGLFWMWLLSRAFPDVFIAGVVTSIGGTLTGGLATLATAVVASAMPGWRAARVSPLEAMNPLGATAGSAAAGRIPWRLTLLGAILLAIDPLLLFSPLDHILAAMKFADPKGLAQIIDFYGHLIVGVPATFAGFFLIAPLLIRGIELLLARPLAAIAFVPVRLLRQQLASGPWRAAGTAAALMVGLAALVVMEVQGYTVIGGWKLPDKFPDIFIWSNDLVAFDQQKAIADTPGILPGSLMPVVVTTPSGDSKASLAIATALAGNNVGLMFIAADPALAMRLIDMEFRGDDGRPLPPDQQHAAKDRAIADLNKGRHIIITEEFRESRHLKLGDVLTLQTSMNGKQPYTICGIVWSPGADALTVMYDLNRLLDKQAIGTVFGTIADAKRDFGVTGARLFAANLEPGVDKATVLKDVQARLGAQGLSAGDVRQIKYDMDRTFFRLLRLCSAVALAAMAVASLGVANTVLASVRSRRWQFGILRSIGASRGQILRLVLTEAALLGLAGVVLGLGAGLELATDKFRLNQSVIGYAPPVIIPWTILIGGCVAVMVVSLVASWLPASEVARTEVLELLQAGRTAN